MAHRFRELKVWQDSMLFVKEVYTFTQDFPKEELYGLTSQTRRAALSIPLNISEGAGNESGKEFARFLGFALRSTYETMTAIELAARLGFANQERCHSLIKQADHIAAMLVGLRKRVENQ